jgi:hypothetical protein
MKKLQILLVISLISLSICALVNVQTTAQVTASKLVFSAGGGQSLTAGVVSPIAIVIQRQNASGSPVATGTSAITVTLSTSSIGGAFYSNSAGTTLITQIAIASGSSISNGFYYKDTVASASTTLTVESSGLTSATTVFTIGAASASKLVFSAGGGQSLTAGVVSPIAIVIQRQDAYGNPATGNTISVALTSSSNGATFYSNSGGTTVITSRSISSGTSNSTSFYYKDTVTGNPTLTGTRSGLTSATTQFSITAPVPSPSPSPTPTSTATPTPSPSPSPSPSPTPTSTATPTPSPSPSPSPSPTPTLEPTPTSTPTLSVIPTSTPKPASTPKVTPFPLVTPLPSTTPLETTIKAKTDNGATVDLAIRGNVTSLQMSNVIIETSQFTNSTKISFTVKGENDATGFSIITIPKTIVPDGATPDVFIDDQLATNQGYTQDPENFYVWYTTQFSTHQLKILFTVPLLSQATSSLVVLAVAFIVPEFVLVYSVLAIRRLRRKPEST